MEKRFVGAAANPATAAYFLRKQGAAEAAARRKEAR
jgi:hypothetical protein